MGAGGIEISGSTERFRHFAHALEKVRERFLNERDVRSLSMTDLQLTERLAEVRNRASQLMVLLDDPVFEVQTTVFGKEMKKNGIWLDECGVPSIEPLAAIIGWADVCLAALKRRQKQQPNLGARLSAVHGGLNELAVGLAQVWRIATGNKEPSCARGSSMIPFLREGMQIIRQRVVTVDSARYWACIAVKDYFA